MARPNTALITGSILIAFAAGLILGLYIDRGDIELRDSAGNPLIAPQPRRIADAARQPFQAVRDADAPRGTAPQSTDKFSFERLTNDMSGDVPRSCISFNRPLDVSGETNYADYIRLTPKVTPAVLVDKKRLCISGLVFNREYQLRLRAGLPSAEGEGLARAEDLVIAFGDKPAYVGFAGDGVILPRLEADGVGIETVNVSKLKVSIFRVSDRALAMKAITSGGALGEQDYYYVYGEKDGEDVGVRVFNRVIDIMAEPNITKTTVFPFGAALAELTPGAYFVRLQDASPGTSSEENRRRVAQAWRWLMFTDLALTTYSGGDGIDITVRSLDSGRPKGNVDLQLIAANNDVLARTSTSSDGFARFNRAATSGEGPQRPRMIMAYGPNADFSVLDLRRPALDLADYDIAGRDFGRDVDGYVYLDRGIYRPGETVRITGLLRDAAGFAVERGAVVRVLRPNGVEAERFRVRELQAGGFSIDYETPTSAPRGVWRLEVEADGAGVVARETFSVEDFVPQRLAVEIDMDEETAIFPGETRPVKINARYLYGAPGANLKSEAEARLRVAPNPFPDFSDYAFGDQRSAFRERIFAFDVAQTDAEGTVGFGVKLPMPDNDGYVPLRADLVVGVAEPGGRVVRESARIPFRPHERYLGLKLGGNGQRAGLDKPVDLNIISLDRSGKPVGDAEVEWRLIEEDYWFEWYRLGGAWRWRRNYRDIPVDNGRIKTNSDGGAQLAWSLKRGSYRVAVRDVQTGVEAVFPFYVGWRSYGAGAQKPDTAAMSVISENVSPGAKVRLFIDPPYAGEAVIAIATDRVHKVQRIGIDGDGRELTIDTDPAWGAGFYVLATIVTPRDAVDRPIPRRAIATTYVPFDMSDRKLKVQIETPDVVRPAGQIELPVKVDGGVRGEDIFLTLAAVDEGILRLTKFTSPDPSGYFFGKKRLGVEIHDDYGRILDPNLAAASDFGGDQIGGEGLSVVPTKTLALFSGPVVLDDDGRARIAIDIPDFNGELRLMATAWSVGKVGAHDAPLTVRDPVPTLLSLPRFLAPGDKADATLLIDNVEGTPGAYSVRLTDRVSGAPPVRADFSRDIPLDKNVQASDRFPLTADIEGIGDLELSVQGPEGYRREHDYQLQVRSPYFPQTKISTRRIAAGETLSLDGQLFDGVVADSAEAVVSFSPLDGISPDTLLASLSKYPYGCTEQLVSQSFPLLFAGDLAQVAGQAPQYAMRPQVQEAINRLLARQSPDGSFGLWNMGDRNASGWIGAYTTDFLSRARSDGYAVPENALRMAYGALRKVADLGRWSYVGYQSRAYEGSWSNDTTDQYRKRSAAYAMYVLAMAEEINLSDLRYFHDAHLSSMRSPLAKAQIGAALAYLGDRARAVSAFNGAIEAIGFDNTGNYYQSALRDAAGVVALLAEVENVAGLEIANERLRALMKEPSNLNTQEKAFTLLAAQALLRSAGDISINAGGQVLPVIGGTASQVLLPDALSQETAFTNNSDGPLFVTVSVTGSPSSAPVPMAKGFTIEKRIYSLSGEEVDLETLQQNDRLAVVISGEAIEGRINPSIIADLLPAGFEIEAVLRPEDGRRANRQGAYAWIGKISQLKLAEARDDRFIAALDLRKEKFTAAYIVRAVTPGNFAIPGAVIEDMYRPGVAARSAAGRINIRASE
ncbi:MAG: alpha-2-macroglobulin family protein [Parvularculaceae bacterium]|nr:MAG: alpha-2-macroglobulin family protein [Parvularculaceae bacterium]